MQLETKQQALAIAKAAADKKARDIVLLDMDELAPSTDWFVICSARSNTQARSVADNIEAEMDKTGVHFLHKEGYNEAEWILMDYGDVVVHIFIDESREYFALESLWSEAELIPYEE